MRTVPRCRPFSGPMFIENPGQAMKKGIFLSLVIPARNRPSRPARLLDSLLLRLDARKERLVGVIGVDAGA